ncbi:uncharacterized protein LOC129869795 [Solanum dulcamara]|uniref:uncharacterized protein LOC129869795 n=1 Tax=Solanum dulcamara TaxID=45834 RepID=UPI002485F15D|nr:uncharacterized protein LOC129869795 [Solanum dulcamara]
MVKLNIDESGLDNPGKIGAVGILRDHKGNLIYVFATTLEVGSNNQAEVQATSFGISWCIQHGYIRVILEIDLELVVIWLKKESNLPWRIIQHISELQELVRILDQFQCKHVYREANFPTNTLSKYIHRIDTTHHIYTYKNLP